MAAVPPFNVAPERMNAGNAGDEEVLAAKLADLVSQSSSLHRALRAARSLGLSSWCIGAGVIRNLVWDHLHGFETNTPADDMDFVFFDPSNLSPEFEQRLESRLLQAEPGFNWEAVNQAAVHTWPKPHGAQEIQPFCSLSEGIASWPEVATCVGVTLTHKEKIEVIAPHGLTDLFEMVVRWNPTRVPVAVYEERLARKRFAQRWPQVKVLGRQPEKTDSFTWKY